MGRSKSQYRSQRAKTHAAKRTKLRIRVPASISSQQAAVTGPRLRHKFEESHATPVIKPHPASKPSENGRQGLLELAPEVRLNIYNFLHQPADVQLLIDDVKGKNKRMLRRVKCLSSRQFPLLGTCRLLRKEALAYLLSLTQLTLRNGIRPRIRHDPSQHGFLLWQLCNIQHVAIDVSRKMQFEFFSRLKTLTLLWPDKPITIRAPATWRPLAYLWSDGGSAAMTAIAILEVRSSKDNWIQKLAARKKKRFRLQMRGIFGCRDQCGHKSNSLVEAVIDVDKGKLVERKDSDNAAATVQWWTLA